MDLAYSHHSHHAKRKNRSSTNLNHLSLAPLTTKIPLRDAENLPDSLIGPPVHSTSYLQGKSAPSTPGLLSRSPVRSNSQDRRRSTPSASLPKSRSATHLAGHGKHKTTGTVSPNTRRRKDDVSSFTSKDRSNSDWLLRAGALISSETRESKGQAWLSTRESSTSLTGIRDAEDEAFERELALEREITSRSTSRRGSTAAADDPYTSPPGSRLGSRPHSRVGSRTQLLTPRERRAVESYFQDLPEEDDVSGPDFVNLDEKLEAIEQDTSVEDEDHVRRLVKREKAGVGSWLGNVLGWPLFDVQENDEEGSDEADGDLEGDVDDEEIRQRRPSGARQLEGEPVFSENQIPPPKQDEGGWQDAAWLLTVASKVIL